MDNHFHLVLQLPEADRLSPLMTGLLVAYCHHYRRRCRLVAHLFQGRFKSPAIEADAYLPSYGRYVERNPVEASLVARPWDYAWSSARAYALGQSDALLTVNPWYEALAAEAARRQTLWRDFLLGDDAKEAVVRRDDWVGGGEDFRRRMQRRGARPSPRGRGRPVQPGASARGKPN